MVEELYNNIGGDYNKAIGRMQDDERIKKYLKFFLYDESFSQLKNGIESKNCEEAFKGAHTLKGVSQNMSFEVLSTKVIEITEELRAGNLETAITLFPEVEKTYEKVINEIKKIVEM